MHELEDERPIPLGRAAAAVVREARPAADGNRGAHDHGCPGSAEPTTARPASADVDRAVAPTPPRQPAPTFVPPHIERTRPEPRPGGSGARGAGLTLPELQTAVVDESAAATPTVALSATVVSAAPERAAAQAVPAPPAAGHPLAALRGLRMEVEPVEPVRSLWLPALVRFLVLYVVVLGSVLVLISLFVAFVAQAGSGHP